MAGTDERSPRIEWLITDVERRGEDAVRDFWAEVGQVGSPLVEPLEDGREALVTFLWRGEEPGNVVVLGWFLGLDAAGNRLHRLPGTDVWHRTYRLPMGLRGAYWLSPDDPLLESPRMEDWDAMTANWQPDPLNPRTERDLWYPDDSTVSEQLVSVLELPGAPPQEWIASRPDVPRGRVEEHRLRSIVLAGERRFWVYVPEARDVESYDLLVAFDGHSYLHVIPTPTVLDNLIAAGVVPPTIAVLVDNPSSLRDLELTCNPSFVGFLAEELLPWLRERYPIGGEPSRVTVAGSSYGGLAAAYAAITRPDIFGNVLSQSGSYWWRPEGDDKWEWLTRQFSSTPPLPLRFYLDVGVLETDGPPDGPSQLSANRHLRDVLIEKGYPVEYTEFVGGHDALCWRGTFGVGLIALSEMRDSHL